MIFYWQKFFYLKNIQRSILVRCRLGKLAFFIIATPITPIKTHPQITALRTTAITEISQFICCSNYLAIVPSLLLKLSISFVYLTAHKGVNLSYILLIIVHKFITVKHKLCITKCKDLVDFCVSYVIIRAQRFHARKDNNSNAHSSLIINN